VLVVSAFGTAGVVYLSRALRPREPLALRSGDAAARDAYRMARRAVKALEHLVERDNLVPFLTTEDRKEIDDIIREFDEA